MAEVQVRIGNLLFEWDEVKARINMRKHRISFLEAATAFGDFLSITVGDPEASDVEDRFLLIGESAERRLLVVVHVMRDGVRYRIISARRPTRTERMTYESGGE